jgi:hypothetical protein
MLWALISLAYVGTVAINLALFIRAHRRAVTRGDLAFFLYLSVHGPIALPAALLAQTGDWSKFWGKPVRCGKRQR